jgi:amino acid adenylation domain-containing protein
MIDSVYSRLPRSAPLSEDLAEGFVGETIAERGARPRPGDELLRNLPAQCRSCDAPNSSRTVATYSIAPELMDRLSQDATALRASRDAFLLAAFAVLLARLAGQEAVTLCRIENFRALLTLTFDSEDTLRSLLAAVLYEPASDVDEPCAVEFVGASSGASSHDIPKYGLRMTVQGSDSETQVELASTTGLWDQSVLRLWLRYFDRLLIAATAAPDTPWKKLELLNAAEALDFYRAFNSTDAAYPAELCVHELVMQQAERTPDAVAIVAESQQLTYQQLDKLSNAIAQRLQALGAGPDRPVAVLLERTANLPLALLSVLKAGSCYVPLDPQDAPQRLASILDECRPAAMIVERSSSGAFRRGEAIPVVHLDDVPGVSDPVEWRPPRVTPDHRAYIIYTSGTTGKPKGVVIPHRGLVNLLHFLVQEPGFKSFDRLLAVAPMSFDIATMDMFLPLVAGGTLVVADRLMAADPVRLAEMIERSEITVMFATPVTWRLLATSGWQGRHGLKMITGGEALPRDLANQLLCLGRELWNCYGPTETTIMSGVLKVHAEPGIVPLGPPIANTRFYVVDSAGQVLPPGVPGELYISGTGVSPGYVERPVITRERFLPDPWSGAPDAHMFRTGDIVRLVNGNNFEFLGRLDHQVKLRGYRIELEEIESALRSSPGIDNAVAVVREDRPGEPYLMAYVTLRNAAPELRRLRENLSQSLPSYMVPNRFAVIDAMPLTASGKIDRKALHASGSATAELHAVRQTGQRKPETALESKLLEIFRDVLNTAEFGVTDSFFDYGGYSLLAVKLFTRINRALSLNLPISLLFDTPTVRALAENVDRRQSPPIIVPIRPRGNSAPLFVIHSYLLYGVLPQIVEQDRPVYGVRELPSLAEMQSVEARAATYVKEILRTYSNGPLLLTGWCAAGSLTLEIARQLHALGRQVGLVALLDAERPGYQARVRGYRAAQLMASLRFHRHRLRKVKRGQKFSYLQGVLLHLRDSLLEALFMHHYRLLLRLQRRFAFSLSDALFDNDWSRVAVLQNYAPVNYPGKVILFRALDVPQISGSDETLGWKEIVDDGVEVIYVPGDHESMFRHPNVDVLSKRLCQALQRCE